MAHTTLPAQMRSAMLANADVVAAIEDRVFYQTMDRNQLPYVWFSRTGVLNEDDLEGNPGIAEESYDIEIISDRSADALIDGVMEALQGMIGTHDVQYVDIENADDEYGFRSADEVADYMTALRVTVFV